MANAAHPLFGFQLRKLSSSSSAATAGDTGTAMDMHLSGEVVLNGHKCRSVGWLVGAWLV